MSNTSAAAPKVCIIIQARLTSSRLPGKVLAPIGPYRAIELQNLRLKRLQTPVTLLYAIPDTVENDPLEVFLANTLNERVVRGDEHDVLDRFWQAASTVQADYFVRLTADCPLLCPKIVDALIAKVIKGRLDYCSNTQPPTFADGLDVECLSFRALKWTHEHIKDPSWREHVTYGLVQSSERPAKFKLDNMVQESGINNAWMRLTLDTPEDLEALQILATHLNGRILAVDSSEVEEAYDAQEVWRINSHHRRNSQLK